MLVLCGQSYSQKIKYKDLFVLLSAKQYDQAEPFLKRYLAENQDNPNAYLFMGYIFEEKALSSDVLTELGKVNTNTDSAVLLFDRSFKEIDDKELKKNDEFYQMYSRRDLRTGKFGLKLSDIQLDLEKRTKYLKDRRQRILLLHDKFGQTQRIYGRCEVTYNTIASRYKDKFEFYLRSDENLKSELSELSRRYDSCVIAFNDYKSVMTSLGKTGHNQEIDPREIKDFKADGYDKADFLQDEVKLWDYKRWAMSSLEVIQNDIYPIRESLVKLDAGLNSAREKLRKDSISVEPELQSLSEKTQRLGLTKYDPKPMPFDIFNLKIKEIRYGIHLAQTRQLRDTSDLSLKLNLYKKDVALLAGIDSAASVVVERNLDYDVENYKDFVKNSYGSASVLKSLVKTTGDFAISEKAFLEARIKKLEASLNWIVDKTDSIPVTENVKSRIFIPFSIVPDKYTYGLKVQDSVKSYYYAILPSRLPVVRNVHKLDTSIFNKRSIGSIKTLSVSTEKGKFFGVIYSEIKKTIKKVDKIPAFVFQVEAGTLGWSNLVMLDGIPTELSYSEDAHNLSLQFPVESGVKPVVLDKEGKLVPGN
jgi:hypothetical protein